MKSKEIKELINFISNSGLDEVKLETEEIKLHVKRKAEPTYVEALASSKPAVTSPPAAPQPQAIPQTPAPEAKPEEGKAEAKQADEDRYIAIKSPMIGTFYRAASPDDPAFASVGDNVKEGAVVCIVEAMKLFNEIESEVSGKVVQVLVENASPVEYDQPLFLVDPEG